MVYRGYVKGGVVVFDPKVELPEAGKGDITDIQGRSANKER